MIPLKEFICDRCGQIINDPSEGTLEWLSTFDKDKNMYISSNFKIVHRIINSPYKSKDGCYNHASEKGFRDTDLNNIIGKNMLGSYFHLLTLEYMKVKILTVYMLEVLMK
jgi:hypothetical protein